MESNKYISPSTTLQDLILHPGDNVEIVSKVNGHVILDDILVVTK
jgi:hypothetical protein